MIKQWCIALLITDSYSGWASYYYDNQFCGSSRGVSEPSVLLRGSRKGCCNNIGKDELNTLMWGLAWRAGHSAALPWWAQCDQYYHSEVLKLRYFYRKWRIFKWRKTESRSASKRLKRSQILLTWRLIINGRKPAPFHGKGVFRHIEHWKLRRFLLKYLTLNSWLLSAASPFLSYSGIT